MLSKILNIITKAGGEAYFVGGCVRDVLLGITPKDFDIEVYGISFEVMKTILEGFGAVVECGKSFVSLKLRIGEDEFDFTSPRIDSKTGTGHKGFEVISDPFLSKKIASGRRDFTINSIMKHVESIELLDLHGGVNDLRDKILRHTTEAFAEDPLRVLRGMQFAGRFDMSLDPETVCLCKSLLTEFDTLPKERIWGEFEKWILKSVKPSKGLQVLLDTGWVSKFPELECLVNLKQEPDRHPEIFVYKHIQHSMDEMQKICVRDGIEGEERIILMLAMLCHDFGKATTTETVDGKIITHGHDMAGEEPTEIFLERIGCPLKYRERIIMLVITHMQHISMTSVSKSAVRRFAVRLGTATIEQWIRVVEADIKGRFPLEREIPETAKRIYELSKDLKVEKKKPDAILMGRHLIAMGFKQDPNMGIILKAAWEAQLNGEFETVEDGILWFEKDFEIKDKQCQV